MTGDELRTLFQEYGETDESHKFERVAVKFSKRGDLHAFMLLDKIMPDGHTMVSAASHDEIFLDFKMDELAAVITPEQVLDLVRCGVSYDSHHDCLYMFV